jgi:hypothetical protein
MARGTRSRSRSRPINRRRGNYSASSSSSSASTAGRSSSPYGSASPSDGSSTSDDEKKNRFRDRRKRSYHSLAGTRQRRPRAGIGRRIYDSEDSGSEFDDGKEGSSRRGSKNKRERRGQGAQYSVRFSLRGNMILVRRGRENNALIPSVGSRLATTRMQAHPTRIQLAIRAPFIAPTQKQAFQTNRPMIAPRVRVKEKDPACSSSSSVF